MLKQSVKTIQFVKKFKKYKNAQGTIEKERAAKYVADFIKKEGGLFLKVAQYLGTSTDQSKEIQNLSAIENNGIELSSIKTILEKELHVKIDEVFEKIDEKAYTASIGQVHKATLRTGENVAIKVQYPLIEKTLKEQMKLLKLIPTGKAEKKWGVDIGEYQKMIKHLLDEELDYTVEKRKQLDAYNKLKDSKYAYVPKVFEGLSTSKVLCTEFLDGDSASELDSWLIKDKRKLSENLIFSFLEMFKAEFIQADSNHGNYIFLKNKDYIKIGLIDFGQFYSFQKRTVDSLLSFILNLIEENEIDYFSYLVELGFDIEKLKHIKDSLPLLSRIIFEPFIENKPFDLNFWDYKKKIDLVLGENKWWFRSAGGEEFFLLLKSFLGIKNLILKLDGRVNWQQIFLESVAPIKDDLKKFRPKTITSVQTQYDGFAKKIEVKITEDHQQKVKLALPINTIFDLESIIEEDVLKKLEEKNIDIKLIVKNALQTGAKPQVIFKLVQGSKEYSVEIK